MRKGTLKKVAQAYAPFLPAPWKRVGNAFLRRQGDWVQIIGFNSSRWSDDYEPVNSFQFLKIGGDPTAGFLPEGLKNPNGTQRWVNALRIANPASNDHAAKVFEEMAKQFQPPLLRPLQLADIKRLLESSLDYWPHAYALCVMAAEIGNAAEARGYFSKFACAVADKPYDWAEMRKQELITCLREVGSDALRSRLAEIAAEKLRALKLTASAA